MNNVVMITAEQILEFCAAIITISGAVTVIVTWISKVKAPNQLQDERLGKIEERLDKYDEYFKKDRVRIEALEEGNRVTQRAILALLSHGIDGNNIEEMKKAQSELRDYLIGGTRQ